MFDIEHYAKWYDGNANRWWEDLPAGKQRAYEQVVRSAQEHGVQFCFSMNPNLFSKRLVNDDSPDSVDLLFKHFAWMQGLGVEWFNLALEELARRLDREFPDRYAATRKTLWEDIRAVRQKFVAKFP